jgi:hypothetical protein
MEVLRVMLNSSGVSFLAGQDKAAEDLLAMRRVAPAADRNRERQQPESLPRAGGVVCQPRGCDGSRGGA